ncbi:hypothetical protein [Burkholderia gladioli]|uniref:hypothetical protein n=1 Tax=Burkholderia gladioli TaxID=28095 RepID=UPI001640F12F|nr:hypothetical protein [Burkholderia gladioli]
MRRWAEPRRRRAAWAGLAAAATLFSATARAACDTAPSRCPDNPELPAAVRKLVPAGYEALDHLAGSLTDAGRTDYLVVVHRIPDTEARPSARPLLLITQGADGRYTLAARNDFVVMRADQGGVIKADRQRPVSFDAWRPKH